MHFLEPHKLDYVFILEELPEIYTHEFSKYLDRAKSLVDLPSYSIHLLNDVSKALSNLFEHRFGDYLLPLDNPRSLRSEFNGHAELLYRNLGTLSELNFELRDYQYFGVLALASISEALFFDAYLPSKQFPEDWAREDEVLSCLSQTVEAVSFGEAVHPSRSPLTKKIRTEIAKKGSDKRHEPARKIKNQFIRSYTQNKSGLSKRQSAKDFYRELSGEDKRILCPSLVEENAVRTLQDYLRAYKKQITPP